MEGTRIVLICWPAGRVNGNNLHPLRGRQADSGAARESGRAVHSLALGGITKYDRAHRVLGSAT